MYLLINLNGSKYWRLKYRIAGKEKSLPLGGYPDVSLKEARAKAADAKRDIGQGVDPMAERKAQKLQLYAAHENTFEVLANAWFAMISPEWSPTHKERTQNLLKNHLFPWLGQRPINE